MYLELPPQAVEGQMQLTHIGQLAECRREVESHAVVPESPVVARPSIALGHDTVDSQRLEARSKGDSTVIGLQVSQVLLRAL